MQVDPSDPPPYRDARWVALVLTFALLVLGSLLVSVYLGVGALLPSNGASCSGTPGGALCPGSVLFLVLFLPGVGLIVSGTACGMYVLVRGLD